MTKKSTINWAKILNLNTAFWFLIVVTIGISLQQYLLPDRDFWDATRPQYNNYLIFKYSFSHLVTGLNLYELYPDDHGDYFKYSPTFAFFMGLLFYLPNWLGLLFWNFLNVLCLYFGIRLLPKLDAKTKVFILLFVLFELIGNLQNEQSNALMTGFIVLTFVSFERKNILLAALFVALGIYLKVFGVVAAALFLLYPQKLKFLFSLSGWIVVLGLLPLVVISPSQLIDQYMGWWNILMVDHKARYGFSVLGILHKWFGLDPSKMMVLVVGVLLFCLGYIRKDFYKQYPFKLLFLSSILIWVILFNHTAESSGYILAMTGSAIWYFSQEKTKLNTILIISAFVIVSLFSTDLMPAGIRNEYIYPYYIRTLPMLVIWLKVLYDMLNKKCLIQ